MVRKRYIRKTGRRKFRRRFRRPSKMAFAKGKATYPRSTRRLFKKLQGFAETKVAEQTYTDNVFSNGYLTKMPTPAQGTGPNQRIGSKIFVRYVVIKGIYNNNGVTDSPAMRASLVWPKDKAYYNLTNCPASMVAQWNIKNFTVIWDKTYKTGMGQAWQQQQATGVPTQTTWQPNGYSPSYLPVYWKIKVFKSLEIDSAGQYITPFPFIYMLNPGLAGGNDTTFQYSSRMYYTDV